MEDKAQLPSASAQDDLTVPTSEAVLSERGWSALDVAKMGGHHQVVDILRAHGARHSPMMAASQDVTRTDDCTSPAVITKNISPEVLWKCPPAVELPAPFKSSEPSFRHDIAPKTGLSS